jgi:hypothetical protein
MPQVQLQIIRRYSDGEAVVYAENVDLRDNAEYLLAEYLLAKSCSSTEYVRTVGCDSPKKVSLVAEIEEP